MKTLLIAVAVIVLMIGAPSVVAASDTYLDGQRQGSHDYIHGFIGPQVEIRLIIRT